MRFLGTKENFMKLGKICGLKVSKGVGEAHGCKVSFEWRTPHYLPTVNDPPTFHTVERLAKNLLGDSRWVNLDAPSMGGEDFSFLASESSLPGFLSFFEIYWKFCTAGGRDFFWLFSL